MADKWVSNMVYGFTGTRNGMTTRQKKEVARLLAVGTELHHGDCLGADEEADVMASRLGLDVVIHPPDDPSQRAWCGAKFWCNNSVTVLPEKPYLERNRDIVNICARLIACPATPYETLRSGTWATIRQAHRTGVPVTIFAP